MIVSTPISSNSSMNTTRIPLSREKSQPSRRVLRTADTDLNCSLGIQKAVFDGAPERGAMGELGSLELVPGIRMGIYMDHAQLFVGRNCLEDGDT